MESVSPFAERVAWRIGAYNINYLTLDRMDAGSALPQPVGWVLLIYSCVRGPACWREVFNSRDEAMNAGIEWFKALDIVPWDWIPVIAES